MFATTHLTRKISCQIATAKIKYAVWLRSWLVFSFDLLKGRFVPCVRCMRTFSPNIEGFWVYCGDPCGHFSNHCERLYELGLPCLDPL